MQSRYFLTLVTCLMVLAPVPARADFSPVEATPLERFTQSAVEVYTAAEMCKNIPSLHSENYVTLIKAYLRFYFQEEIPYWVLPPVDKAISSRESCIYFIQQGIAHYQEDRRQYSANYPDNPTPPALDNSMMLDGRVYGINPESAGSTKGHVITPSVLVK